MHKKHKAIKIKNLLIGLGISVLVIGAIGLRIYLDSKADEECQVRYGPDWGFVRVNGWGKCVQGVKNF
jgi:hypothetical protein